MINEFDVWQAGIIDAEIHLYPPRIRNKVQAAHEIGDNVAGLRRGSEDLRGRVLEFYCRERKFAGASFRRLVPPQLTSPKIHKIQPGALRGGWGRGPHAWGVLSEATAERRRGACPSSGSAAPEWNVSKK